MRTHFKGSAQNHRLPSNPWGGVAVEGVIRDVAARGVVTWDVAAGGRRHQGGCCRGQAPGGMLQGGRHQEGRCRGQVAASCRPARGPRAAKDGAAIG